MLADVEVVHVDQGNNISVLVVVQENAYFIERELNVESRRFLVKLMVHFDLWRAQ